MKRRNFFGRLGAVAAGIAVAPQALAEAEKTAREFHEATKAVEEITGPVFPGDMYFNTENDTLYVALFTTEPQTVEVYTEGAASPSHIHVAGILKEADYKGYNRVQVGRTEVQWSVVDNKATNKEPIIFPQCSRGYSKITHIGVCLEEDSDPVMQTTLSADVMIIPGVIPHIDAGSLTVEIE